MNTGISSYQSPIGYDAVWPSPTIGDVDAPSKLSGWQHTLRKVAFVVTIFVVGMLAGQWTGSRRGSEGIYPVPVQQVDGTATTPTVEAIKAESTLTVDANEDMMAKIKAESLVENLEHGAVATDDGRCSDIGNNILKNLGGNAIDAAVAVTLCLGIVNPSGSSVGGGAVCFAR
jgi:hypothetical protein